jgi:hypothetical protein
MNGRLKCHGEPEICRRFACGVIEQKRDIVLALVEVS